MAWPDINTFGLDKNPLTSSVWVNNNDEGSLNPPDAFLLMDGTFFLLMDGTNLRLMGP